MIRPFGGLREQKKAMTRKSIADITLRLTLEKGLTRVTFDEIAREAFVSSRTVTNYFAHKEEAIAAAGSLATDDIVYQFLEQPAEDDPLLSLKYVMIALVSDLTQADLEIHRQKLELAELYPTVKSFLIASYQELEQDLAEAIAGRINIDASIDVYSRLLAAAAVDAFRLSLEFWAISDPSLTLAEMLDIAFTVMQDGFPPPGE